MDVRLNIFLLLHMINVIFEDIIYDDIFYHKRSHDMFMSTSKIPTNEIVYGHQLFMANGCLGH